MIRSVKQLVNEIEKGNKFKYLFFWGHRPSADGSIIKSCFSQWWPALFEWEGKKFKTAEHWMMYHKAVLFNDVEIAEKVLQVETPAEAKKLGRKVRGFNPEVWNDHKFDIVVKGNVLKFDQDESLKEFLLGTGKRVIVEASPMDRIWGIGMAESNEKCHDPNKWRGQNLLGFALMEAREILRNEIEKII